MEDCSTSQFHNHAQQLKVENSSGPLDNQTQQTVQFCEYENQTLEAFVATSRLYAKFDCPMFRQNYSPFATAYVPAVVWNLTLAL